VAPSLSSELAHRIRFWRKRAGLKGIELAAALNLSPSAISQWERGHASPSHETLERVAIACGIDLVTFWGDLPE
jgi:transcriptional regulator with XRE-family HTH domain